MAATKGTYKGKATLSLKKEDTDTYSFTFGLQKAKLILQHLAEIQAFVEEYEKEEKK